jgi:hypothetical protein
LIAETNLKRREEGQTAKGGRSCGIGSKIKGGKVEEEE